MSDGFYRAFENKHRGSRELIKSRVEVYLPFVLPLKKIYPEASGLDIGCGRGEWLELLKENNIIATGVDLDEGMLEACVELKLSVELGNGIKHLSKLEDESLSIISAFHVVEHISFEELQTLIKEALRVLKKGGVLILETPNPENIKVATENFYLDPTHIKPIPAGLLSYLFEYNGYERTKLLRLQDDKGLASRDKVSLLDVIGGVSPDYSIVAQKKADKEILEQFDELFSRDIGLSLTSLTAKFENRLQKIEAKAEQAEAKAEQAEAKAEQAEAKAEQAEAKAEQAEAKAEQAEAKAEQAEAKAEQAEAKAEQAEAKAEQAEAKTEQAEAKTEQAEAKANEAEAKANEAEVKLNQMEQYSKALITSTSWRITKPFRMLSNGLKWLTVGTVAWVTFTEGSRPRRVLSKLNSVLLRRNKQPTSIKNTDLNSSNFLKEITKEVEDRKEKYRKELNDE